MKIRWKHYELFDCTKGKMVVLSVMYSTFTEKEYNKIQNNKKIVPKIKYYILFCKAIEP